MDTDKTDTQEIPSITTEETKSLGDIKINHSVVASIVRLAALENGGRVCSGRQFRRRHCRNLFQERILRAGSSRHRERAEQLLNRDPPDPQLRSELAKCAYDVQIAVKDRVENMTGKMVERVDVVIDGVKSKDDHPGAGTETGLTVDE